MTGWGTIDTAVEAMRRGARTFVHKPWDNDALVQTITREISDGRRLAQGRRLRHARTRRTHSGIQRALLPPSLPLPPASRMRHGGELAAGTHLFPAATATIFAYRGRRSRASCSRLPTSAGKGLPAALVMAHLQASIRAFSRRERRARLRHVEHQSRSVPAMRTSASLPLPAFSMPSSKSARDAAIITATPATTRRCWCAAMAASIVSATAAWCWNVRPGTRYVSPASWRSSRVTASCSSPTASSRR